MGDLSTPNSVQKLQTALHAKAKAEPGYRFYALYDKISREDILAHAYAQCRSNKGAPGVDRQDFEDIEAYGVGRCLANWRLRSGRRLTDRTLSERVYIPKANGKLRPLGISTFAGSGLHDSSDAGAGAGLRSRSSIGTLCLPSPGETPNRRWSSKSGKFFFVNVAQASVAFRLQNAHVNQIQMKAVISTSRGVLRHVASSTQSKFN